MLLHILSDIAPLFAGFLVVTSQTAPLDLQNYLERYLITILTFIIWSIAANAIVKLIPQQFDTSYRSLVRVLTIIALIAIFSIALLLLERRTDFLLFQIELLVFVLLSLGYRFLHLQQHTRSLWCFALYTFGTALISFQLSIPTWSWQLLIFCLAITTIIIELRDRLVMRSSRLPHYILSIGIAGIFLLVFSHDLPTPYALSALCMLPQLRPYRPLSATIFLAILISLSFY
jgi:hypothetical protein